MKKESPLYILFADDDEDDRILFKKAINEINANVHLSTVKDGNVLMHALSETEWLPDVIFLDLNMPSKTGMDCLVEIRSDKKLKHIPVIIFSTSDSEDDIEKTYKKGANLYICKPSDYNDQLVLFKKILAINWKEFMPFSSREKFFVNPKIAHFDF